jgi:hypothetical protein
MRLQLIQLMFAGPSKQKLSGLGSGIGMKGSHSLERLIQNLLIIDTGAVLTWPQHLFQIWPSD